MDDREQTIRERAHALWEQHGRPEGQHHEHWLQAEAEIGAPTDQGLPTPDTVSAIPVSDADASAGDASVGDASASDASAAEVSAADVSADDVSSSDVDTAEQTIPAPSEPPLANTPGKPARTKKATI